MMQKFRVSSIDIKRSTMRACPGWVNERSFCAPLALDPDLASRSPSPPEDQEQAWREALPIPADPHPNLSLREKELALPNETVFTEARSLTSLSLRGRVNGLRSERVTKI